MRDLSVTISKAFGIIFMVMAHCGVPYVSKFIYMFHMPLFFILSGYCFKDKYLSDIKTFTLRKIRSLYFPFVKYGLIFLVLHNIFYYMNIYNDQYGWLNSVSHIYSLKETIYYAIFRTMLFTGSEQLLGGYWFLPQLFWASLLGWIVIKFLRYNIIGVVILLLISMFFKLANFTVPYTTISGLTFMSSAFYVAGYGLHKYNIKSFGYLGLFYVALVYIGTFFWYSELPSCPVQKMFPYFITAVLGTLAVMQLSRYIYNSDKGKMKAFLIFTGNHTIEILTWHFLSFKIVSLFAIWLEERPIEMLAMFPVLSNLKINIWWIPYTIIGVCLPLLMVYVKELCSQKSQD